jgi:hypothetical protein
MEPPKNVLKQQWNEMEGKWYLMKRAPKIWRCPFSPIKSAYVTLLGHHKCALRPRGHICTGRDSHGTGSVSGLDGHMSPERASHGADRRGK